SPAITASLQRWLDEAAMTLCPFPAWCMPPHVRLPKNTRLCGVIQPPPQQLVPLPDPLQRFLEAGKSPILVALEKPDEAVQACREIGRRVVVVGDGAAPSDEQVFNAALVGSEQIVPWSGAVRHDADSAV